jgi:hypothetical protein
MGDVYIADLGTDIVDFDADVFADRAEAFAALFGSGVPSAPALF